MFIVDVVCVCVEAMMGVVLPWIIHKTRAQSGPYPIWYMNTLLNHSMWYHYGGGFTLVVIFVLKHKNVSFIY